MMMKETMVRIKLTDFDSLPVGAGQAVTVNGENIVLFRIYNGEVKAVENRSPHRKGGTLADALVSGKFIYCPVYDLKISLEDGKVQAPDTGEVKTFKVEVIENEVYLQI
ncbi:nitrite reductase (NAD(P)H) small subunit [Mesobacillus jeotgali]|uniref:Nitrite reductase (NAD(P)H) small subunit n=1 Tax=Mesobacillus jeotgali TaxID=129985 RepID=A0ABY9VL44_9BACI|nr:nitrite reductase (NAD(P)H) small subunit [Mesobacillus jeotgali]WNF23849.1 nitrite reductase (NAD(P)H) small subunit [Mesobacillus jeotgali]